MNSSKHRRWLKLFLSFCFFTFLPFATVWADNIVILSSTEGAPGDEVTVTVGLTNTEVVSSLQVSIPLDESLTLVEGSEQLSSRCASHLLTVGMKDGVLNLFVYSFSMAAITGDQGEVASFRLKLGSTPITVSLTPSRTILTGSSGQALTSSTESGEVTIRCAKAEYSTTEVDFGAVPIGSTCEQTVTVTNIGNSNLTITNLVFSDINVFSSTSSLPMTLEPGASQDVNITYASEERGSISRTLKVECNSISKLNTIKLKALTFAVNELHIQDASGISDEEVTVNMTMNNMDPVSGYQVDFDLSEQFEYVENSFTLSARKQDHTSIASLNGTNLRIIVYSPTDKPLVGNDGVIGSFKVKLKGRCATELTPTKTVLSATINNKVENVVSAVYGGYIDIQSPIISTNDVLDFGAVSVTEDCMQDFFIDNRGSAPLTISRIVFNNENLSVMETLPLMVPSGGSGYVTVVYSCVEQTAFEATMQLYSNDPEQRMLNVQVRGSRFAPNYLNVETKDIFTGENLQVKMVLDNYDPITGIQFDLIYPSQSFKYEENDFKLTDRTSGMSVTARQLNNNTIRFFCYFLDGKSIVSGNGELLSIQLKPIIENILEEPFVVGISNIKLGTKDMDNKYSGEEYLQDEFYVMDGLRGDVNADGKVNVADFIAVANHILGSTPEVFVHMAADVNRDSTINVSDFIGIANMILSGRSAANQGLLIQVLRQTGVVID